eukprot:TRINITY_DN12606_c0_g2_i4.p1 TRINITY_DN12606_c0_g2~~TRINITY_DN12606_c0_g2_i4.p1  ORF type:complete len:1305 (+),score=369.92 TRINITY_DN12606_c0_g2_i4:454-3915(+)
MPNLGMINRVELKVSSQTENDGIDVVFLAGADWEETRVDGNDWTDLSSNTTLVGQHSLAAEATSTINLAADGWQLPQNQEVTFALSETDRDANKIETLYTRETAGKGAQLVVHWTGVEAPRLVVDTPYNRQLYEDGTAFEVNVALAQAPTAAVYIPFDTALATARVLSPAVLVFDANNWNTPQTVRFQAIDDQQNTPLTRVAELIIRPLHSTDPFYNGYNPMDIGTLPIVSTRFTNLADHSKLNNGKALSVKLEVATTLVIPDEEDGEKVKKEPRFDLLSGPVGMSVLQQAGLLTFNPTADQVGTHTFVIRVNLTQGYITNHTAAVTVTNPGADPAGLYVVIGGGEDVSNAGSAAQPYDSLTYALAQARPGDNVYVRGGSYWISGVDMDGQGSRQKPIVIQPYVNEHVRLNFGAYRGLDFLNTSQHIVLQGFEIDGHANANHWQMLAKGFWSIIAKAEDNEMVALQGGGIAIQINGQDIVIQDNHIHDCYQKAVNIRYGRYITVRHNLIYDIATTSLSGGHGIMRQWRHDFGDADQGSKYRFDIQGNFLFNVEQRIYSWVPWKGYWVFVLDEGKPILIDVTKDYDLKARIDNNLVAFSQGPHIRVKSTRNLEVTNNAVYAKLDMPHADGITDKAEFNRTYFEGFVFRNNLAQTGKGTLAVDIGDAMDESETFPTNRLSGNMIAGGGDYRGPAGGVTNLGPGGMLFTDPLAGDFTPTSSVPSTAGIQQPHWDIMNDLVELYNVKVAADLWTHDHLRNTQTILDNLPPYLFGRREYRRSEEKPNQMAFWYESTNRTWRNSQGDGNKWLEIVLPEDYEKWYNETLVDGQHVDYGTSLIARDVTYDRNHIMLMTLGGLVPSAQYNRLTVEGKVRLNGKLKVVVADGFAVPINHEFKLVVAERVQGSFDIEDLPPLQSDDLAWQTSYTTQAMTLKLINTTEADPNSDDDIDDRITSTTVVKTRTSTTSAPTTTTASSTTTESTPSGPTTIKSTAMEPTTTEATTTESETTTIETMTTEATTTEFESTTIETTTMESETTTNEATTTEAATATSSRTASTPSSRTASTPTPLTTTSSVDICKSVLQRPSWRQCRNTCKQSGLKYRKWHRNGNSKTKGCDNGCVCCPHRRGRRSCRRHCGGHFNFTRRRFDGCQKVCECL